MDQVGQESHRAEKHQEPQDDHGGKAGERYAPAGPLEMIFLRRVGYSISFSLFAVSVVFPAGGEPGDDDPDLRRG